MIEQIRLRKIKFRFRKNFLGVNVIFYSLISSLSRITDMFNVCLPFIPDLLDVLFLVVHYMFFPFPLYPNFTFTQLLDHITSSHLNGLSEGLRSPCDLIKSY